MLQLASYSAAYGYAKVFQGFDQRDRDPRPVLVIYQGLLRIGLVLVCPCIRPAPEHHASSSLNGADREWWDAPGG